MRYLSSLSECIKRLLDMYWNPLQTLNVRKQLFLISVVLSIADILKLENVVSNCQISIVNFHSVIKVSQFINHMLFCCDSWKFEKTKQFKTETTHNLLYTPLLINVFQSKYKNVIDENLKKQFTTKPTRSL